MSATTMGRKAGVLGTPETGPAKIWLAACTTKEPVKVPEGPVTGEPEMLKILGSARPTEASATVQPCAFPRALIPRV